MRVVRRGGGQIDGYVPRAGVARHAARRGKVTLRRKTRQFIQRATSEIIGDELTNRGD